MALGSVLADLGRPTGALREFAAALEIDPHDPAARRHFARVLVSQGRAQTAVAHLERWSAAESGDSELLLLLGIALSRSGAPDLAVPVLTRLVDAEPAHFEARFNLAAAHAQAGDFSEASKHFGAARSLNPEHVATRLPAAKVEVNLRNFEAAVALLEPVEGFAPGSADELEAAFVRGTALRALGRVAEAESALRQVVAAVPDRAENRHALGALLADRGDLAEARRHLRRARELAPDSQAIRSDLIAVLRGLGDSEGLREAIVAYDERRRRERLNQMAAKAAERAGVFLGQGRAGEALREYAQGLGYTPEDASLHYGEALAHAALGQPEERVSSLKRAIAIDPEHSDALNELGLAYVSGGRPSDAEVTFKRAIEANSNLAAARGNLGVLYVGQGRFAEGEHVLRRAVEDVPSSAPMRVNHALALAGLGRLSEALTAAKAARAIDPAEPKASQAVDMIEAALLARSRDADR